MFIDIKKKGKDWDLSNELVGYKKMYYCNSFGKKKQLYSLVISPCQLAIKKKRKQSLLWIKQSYLLITKKRQVEFVIGQLLKNVPFLETRDQPSALYNK